MKDPVPAPPHVMMFLKAPRTQTVKTRLAAEIGDERTVDVYRGMVERQLRQIPVGWSVAIHFAPADAEAEMRAWLGTDRTYAAQVGHDLGERMLHAFAAAFAAGHGLVMAIGGDCPELDPDTFEEARTRLARADVVLGPAEDGGYYMIALRRFTRELFKDIPWSTAHVLSLTLARAKIAGLSRELLTPKADIDDGPSYDNYLARVASASSGDRIAIIIPALNEAPRIAGALHSVRQSFPGSTVVVVDGGSTDGTREVAGEEGARVISAARGRGFQCRAGVKSTPEADWLLFLHADTLLPTNAHEVVNSFIGQPRAQVATFRLRFDDSHWLLRVSGWLTRIDSVFTRFGDQAILIRREFYEALGGFPDWPLLEDVALLQRARSVTPIHSLAGYVVTSARRFREVGVIRQQLQNGRLLTQYLRGTSPTALARRYQARSVATAPETSVHVEVSPPSISARTESVR